MTGANPTGDIRHLITTVIIPRCFPPPSPAAPDRRRATQDAGERAGIRLEPWLRPDGKQRGIRVCSWCCGPAGGSVHGSAWRVLRPTRLFGNGRVPGKGVDEHRRAGCFVQSRDHDGGPAGAGVAPTDRSTPCLEPGAAAVCVPMPVGLRESVGACGPGRQRGLHRYPRRVVPLEWVAGL